MYIVDTCIINKLVDGLISVDDLPNDGEYIASHIQIDELNKTKNEKRRAILFLTFAKQVNTIAPTESVILDVSRVGECRLGDGEIYSKIKTFLDNKNNSKPNNVQDALIAETAIKNQFTLLTTDYHLKEAVESLSGSVIYWNK